MKNKKFWLGMLVVALALGMTACGGGDEPTNGPSGGLDLPGTVTITGNTYVGQTLTANTDNLGGSGTISYQWKRGTTYAVNSIANATGRTYILTEADLNNYIAVSVDRPNYMVGKSSTAVGPVTTGPLLTGTVSITGTANVGQTLTVNTGSLGGSGTISYQWKRGDSAGAANTNITNATESNYILSSADYGKYVTVSVTRSGNGGSVSGTAIGPIADAITWTQVSTSIFGTGRGNGVAYNGSNQWVAVGDGGILAYSANGETWTKVSTSIFSTNNITSIAYGNGKWIAVGGYSSDNAASSTNGTTWTAITLSSGWADCVAYGNNRWIVGNRMGGMVTSTDTTTWTSVTNPLSSVNSIAYGNSRWVAVGNNGSMATSTDGQNWTTVNVTSIFTYYTYPGDTGTIMAINTVSYANNLWVAAGGGGIIATSTNGQTWTAVTDKPISTATIQTVAYGNNKWLTAGDFFGLMDSGIAVSANGSNWVSIANTTFGKTPIKCIAFGNNKWVAVGNDSKIAYANDN